MMGLPEYMDLSTGKYEIQSTKYETNPKPKDKKRP